jgi:hypothetical protein
MGKNEDHAIVLKETDNIVEAEAELYVHYLSEGLDKNEAYLKIKPQHKDKNPKDLNAIRYRYEQGKVVKSKLKRLSAEIYLCFQNQNLQALQKQYEIGMGKHGGSLKTQADALHQFIQNTSNPYTRVTEETENKIVNENRQLLDSISNLFDSIGKQVTQTPEEILEVQINETSD